MSRLATDAEKLMGWGGGEGGKGEGGMLFAGVCVGYSEVEGGRGRGRAGRRGGEWVYCPVVLEKDSLILQTDIELKPG